MAAGHYIPLIVLQGIQGVSHKISDETPLQWDGVEMSHCITRPNGRKKDVANKRNIVSKEQDEDAPFKLYHPTFQIKDDNESDRDKIIAQVSQGHDVRKPGNDPLLHPQGGVDPENKEINLHQAGVDIRLKILYQFAERLIDENDKKEGRKLIEICTHPPHSFSTR